MFNKILTFFPPCWKDANKSYRTFLTEPLHIKFDSSKNYLTGETGIFDTIFDMLEDTLKLNGSSDNVSNDFDSNSSMNDSSIIGNYEMWASKNKRVYSFDALHRDEKVHRLFVLLELLICLLENDLSMWIVCYPVKKNVAMNKLHKMPLIGFVLWQLKIPGEITIKIRKILTLFVACIGIGMPQRFIDIFGVNIMFQM